VPLLPPKPTTSAPENQNRARIPPLQKATTVLEESVLADAAGNPVPQNPKSLEQSGGTVWDLEESRDCPKAVRQNPE